MKQHALNASDRERRDDHRPAAADGVGDDLGKGVGGVSLVVLPVAIGGLDQKIVGAFDRHRVDHRRVAVAADVAGEDDGGAGPIDLDGRRAQDVPHPAKPQLGFAGQHPLFVKRHRRQLLKRGPRVVFGVERQRGLVLGKLVAVGVVGVLLLQVPGIRQQDRAQLAGGARAEDAPLESTLDHQRQIAAVIEMRVREDNRPDGAGLDRERRPVLQTQRFEALKQSAIDKQIVLLVLEQEFRAGHRAGAAQEGERHGHGTIFVVLEQMAEPCCTRGSSSVSAFVPFFMKDGLIGINFDRHNSDQMNKVKR